jgi:hypothetical protein
MVKELLTPQSKGDDRGNMGLGVFVQGGRRCILMTNSDNGWPLQKSCSIALLRCMHGRLFLEGNMRASLWKMLLSTIAMEENMNSNQAYLSPLAEPASISFYNCLTNHLLNL